MAQGPGGVWEPDPNPLLGYAQTIGQINENKLYPLRAQQLQLGNTGQQIQNTTAQTGLQNTYATNLQQVIASVPRDDPNYEQNVRAAVARSAGARYPQEMANSWLGGVDVPGATSIRDLANQATMAAGTPQEIAATIPQARQTNVGGSVVTQGVTEGPGGVNVAPATGAASLATTLTPSEKVSRVPYVNPDTGVPGTVPIGAITSPTGQPEALAGVTGQHGELQTGLAPGAGEGRSAVGQASGQQYAADLADLSGAQTRITQLKEIEQLLQTPEGKTGPGTQVTNGWRNFLLGNMPAVLKVFPGLDQAQVQSATQDELKKYMTQVALAQSGQFGPSTNEKLAAASSGNANPDMSNLANQDVTRMNLALNRAQQARLAAFQKSGLPPEQYSTWASNWNRQVDPRAFMLDVLSKQERQKALSSITTPAAKSALLRGKAAAEQAGLYQESDIPR